MAQEKWTAAEYRKYLGKTNPPSSKKAIAPTDAAKAVAVEPEGRMNKLESAYAAHLDLLKRAGEIHDWRFEPMNFRIAKKCFYKIDFLVINKAMQPEFHETKGYWQDDALVKFKAVAALFPFFIFKAIMRKDGQFYVERIG